MRAKSTAELLVDLGVAASFSRPRVSNDNPFSEAQFKTLKYRPEFPERFDGIEHARAYLREFFAWYNEEHRHSGIGFMTPAAVHFGRAAALHTQRAVLQAAYAAHPERFKGRIPTPPALPEIVGINLPTTPTMETVNDLTATPALLTNFHNRCLKVIDTFRTLRRRRTFRTPEGTRVGGQATVGRGRGRGREEACGNWPPTPRLAASRRGNCTIPQVPNLWTPSSWTRSNAATRQRGAGARRGDQATERHRGICRRSRASP